MSIMNEQDILTLSKLGLSEKQARVYLALLELGEANMTRVAEYSMLKRPTVYLIIEELSLLGLVSEITKGKKKVYSAIHPRRIGELLVFRKNQFDELLPSLNARYGLQKDKPRVQLFEGMDGLMHAYKEAFELLAKEKEGLWTGNIELLEEKYPEVLKQYDRMLASLKKYKIREIVFGGEKTKKWIQKMDTRGPSHQIRFWNIKNDHPATDELIIGNKTMIFSLKNEISTLIIESEEIAKSNRARFEHMWETIN